MGAANNRRRAKKEAARRERIRQGKHRRHQSGDVEKAPASSTATPTFIDFTYPTPATLTAVGPLIPGAWTIPAALEAWYHRTDTPLPTPVSGFLLVDTGASSTCISLDAANELGLLPRRLASNYGAGGVTSNPVFWARLLVEIQNEHGATTAEMDDEVVAIPNLEESLRPLDVKAYLKQAPESSQPVRLIGLLGRDFLSHATLLYEGSKGHCRLTLDVGSFQKPAPTSLPH